MRIADRLKWMLLVLVIVVLALPGSWAAAQDDEGDPEFGLKFAFEGTVVSIDEDSIVVDVEGYEFGMMLAPAGSFNPSTLSVGDLVRFNGALLNDDTIKVSELEIIEEAAEEPVEDPEDEGDDEGDDESVACGTEDHPVISALADSFELDYAVVVGYACEGYGVGEIARALLLAEQTGLPVDDIFAMRESGMGWGNIVKELGVSPSSLAPGRIVSEEKKDKNNEEEQDENAPGNSANAPGQQGDDDAPGNSANAPGQQKDDDDDGPGKSENAPGQQKKKK